MLAEVKRLFIIAKIARKYQILKYLKNIKKNNNIILDRNFGINLRSFCEESGPIFIKLGQILSTRYDLLPAEVIDELKYLQDRVKPFDNSVAHNIIKQELGQDYNKLFSNFSADPIASASVAQVYTGQIDEQEIIIKILRPNLSIIIEQDLKVIRFLNKYIIKLYPELKRFKPDELIEELNRVLIDEQDLLREAANASQVKRNFAHSDLLYIPKIYWSYCSKNILVMEKIHGIDITDVDKLKENNIDLKLLARKGIEIFFTQVFEHCLFHGDIHPGNIFINKDNNNFYLIDFGIMGSLGPDEQYYLASNLWAFLNRDYRKVARLHVESGWVDKNTRIDLLEAAIRTVSEPILEKSMSEISFGELLVRLFDVAKSHNMQLQPQLLVFKKTLINIEAMAHKLDPDLDLWATARPFIEKWMKKQLGISGFINRIIKENGFTEFDNLFERLKEYNKFNINI